MPIVLMILLGAIVAYAITLVVSNLSPVVVDLLFYQSPAMSLGVLLLLVIALGFVAGVLLMGIYVAKNRWEVGRLRKELDQVRNKQIQQAASAALAAANAAKQAEVPVAAQDVEPK